MGETPGPRDAKSRRRGFTLIEVAMATAIIGIGVVALMSAMGAGTQAAATTAKMNQAVFLAREIREWTLRLPFSSPDPNDANNPPGPDGHDPNVFVNDLDDLMSITFKPPRDGTGTAIASMSDWSQKIAMTWRSPGSLTTVVANGTSDFINVQVVVSCRSSPILTTNWLVARRKP